MAFKLEVEFTGLCLYFIERSPDKDGKKQARVTVLMPDCRRGFADKQNPVADDGEPHVGYLRANVANIAGIADTGLRVVEDGDLPDEPKLEFVYQFDREVLTFQTLQKRVAASPVITTLALGDCDYQPLGLPNFATILANEALAPESATVSNGPLLFKTALPGGTIRGRRGNGSWAFPGVSVNGGAVYGGQFSEVITWTSDEIEADALVLKFSRPDGVTDRQSLPLAPMQGDNVVRLKIANLCSTNPLEWDNLTMHVERTNDDDFRWLYRLLPVNESRELRVPVMTGWQALGAEDCLGVSFPE